MAEAVPGSYVKLGVAYAKSLPPALRDAFSDELGSARADIRSAALFEWIPLKTYVDLPD